MLSYKSDGEAVGTPAERSDARMRKLVEVIKALLKSIVGKVVTVNVTVIVVNVKTAPESDN